MSRTMLTGHRGSSGPGGAVIAPVLRRAIAPLRHRGAAPWIAAGLGVAGIAALVALASGDLGAWIDDRAHMLGHALDHGVAAVARGDAGAWSALLSGSALYGFLHALGPGHGKVLVSGVGAGSGVTARRLMGLSLAASLAQSVWAIALVYGALALLGLSIAAVTGLARDVLAPLGAAFIAGIGALMLWRTAGPIVRDWLAERSRVARVHAHAHAHTCGGHAPHAERHSHDHACDHDHGRHRHEPHEHGCGHAHHARGHGHHGHEQNGHGHHGHSHDHDHDHHDGHQSCGCGHAHAPTIEAVAKLERPWDAVTLVAGIAVRPCTSALIVLALAWQAGVPLAGALAALAMGLGTAALVCLVAGSSVLARRMALLGSTGPAVRAHLALRLVAGTTLTLLGLAMLGASA